VSYREITRLRSETHRERAVDDNWYAVCCIAAHDKLSDPRCATANQITRNPYGILLLAAVPTRRSGKRKLYGRRFDANYSTALSRA
jgi:hypothetical protein